MTSDSLPSDQKLYAERDIIAQGKHYAKHIDAMTAEGLHAKTDIAAELAHRDIEIERLLTIFRHVHVARYSNGLLTDECGQCGLDIRHPIHLRQKL